MTTTTELISELTKYLQSKYNDETSANKELIMEFIGGLKYVSELIDTYELFVTSLKRLVR